MRSSAIGAVALVAALLAAGCAGSDQPAPGGSPSGSAPRDSTARPAPSSLQEVCEGVRLVAAEPYAGAAVHPVMVFRPGTGSADTPKAFVPVFFNPPTQRWAPALEPKDTSLVQLVGCADRVAETATGTECDFDIGPPAPLYTARYRFTLREARTGAVLADTTVPSSRTCPGAARVRLGNSKVYAVPAHAAYLKVLEPFLFWNGRAPKPSRPR